MEGSNVFPNILIFLAPFPTVRTSVVIVNLDKVHMVSEFVQTFQWSTKTWESVQSFQKKKLDAYFYSNKAYEKKGT